MTQRLQGKVVLLIGAGSSGSEISNGSACAPLKTAPAKARRTKEARA